MAGKRETVFGFQYHMNGRNTVRLFDETAQTVLEEALRRKQCKATVRHTIQAGRNAGRLVCYEVDFAVNTVSKVGSYQDEQHLLVELAVPRNMSVFEKPAPPYVEPVSKCLTMSECITLMMGFLFSTYDHIPDFKKKWEDMEDFMRICAPLLVLLKKQTLQEQTYNRWKADKYASHSESPSLNYDMVFYNFKECIQSFDANEHFKTYETFCGSLEKYVNQYIKKYEKEYTETYDVKCEYEYGCSICGPVYISIERVCTVLANIKLGRQQKKERQCRIKDKGKLKMMVKMAEELKLLKFKNAELQKAQNLIDYVLRMNNL